MSISIPRLVRRATVRSATWETLPLLPLVSRIVGHPEGAIAVSRIRDGYSATAAIADAEKEGSLRSAIAMKEPLKGQSAKVWS